MKGNNDTEILNSNVQSLFYVGTQRVFLLQNSSVLVLCSGYLRLFSI
jgi:hypothetical protein